MVTYELITPLIYLNIYLFIYSKLSWLRDVTIAYVKFNFWATDDNAR